MRTFIVKVRTTTHAYTYDAIGLCSADLVADAWDQFADARCVTVMVGGSA